jgi:hypothetical protein
MSLTGKIVCSERGFIEHRCKYVDALEVRIDQRLALAAPPYAMIFYCRSGGLATRYKPIALDGIDVVQLAGC